MTTPKSILSRVLFLMYLGAIALLCFISGEKIPDIQREIFGIPTDKLVHFFMFLPFPILSYMAWDHKGRNAWGPVKFFFGNLLAGACLAALTEWIQDMLPTRSMDLHDFWADMLALGLARLFVFIIDITHISSRRN